MRIDTEEMGQAHDTQNILQDEGASMTNGRDRNHASRAHARSIIFPKNPTFLHQQLSKPLSIGLAAGEGKVKEVKEMLENGVQSRGTTTNSLPVATRQPTARRAPTYGKAGALLQQGGALATGKHFSS